MKKLIVFLVMIMSVQAHAQKKEIFATKDYVLALKHATDVMVNDATSPVAASRYYAYINLACVETAALFYPQQPHFAGVVKGLKSFAVNDTLVKKSDAGLSTLLVLYRSAIRLLPSGYLLKSRLDSLQQVAKKRKLSAQTINSSANLAAGIIDQVMKYVSTDGFSKLSGLKRFTPSKGDQYWQPTGPGFISAVEPHWKTLRTFTLDSCSQFSSEKPAVYNTDTNSVFYKGLREVYDITRNLSKEQTNIAMFWDCNPFALRQVGHLEFGVKKISPGGHWMGITGIACKKQQLSMARSAYIFAFVSIGIADAFIACWYDKYRDNRVRPVTAIKKLIDQNWEPILQTPPFPEYTSGHSIISTTAAVILTHLMGDKLSFADDTEVEFGLPVRKFSSFLAASNEASVSRLYGGIHFRDAINTGINEGHQVGEFVIAHITDQPANTINEPGASSAPVKN